MIQVIYCMRRKSSLSPEAFLAHWEGIHVPIVMANLAVLRLTGYERTVPMTHRYSERIGRRGTMQPAFDGVARLSWACEEDMRHAFESEEALAVQRRLALDEQQFVDVAASCRWVAQPVRHL